MSVPPSRRRGFPLAKLLRLVALLSSVRNRVLNVVAGGLCGARVSIDWRSLKISHPERISIGARFSAGHSLWLESVDGHGRIEIGDDVNFSDFVHVGSFSSVRIEAGVLVGSKVLITDHSHGRVVDVRSDVPPNKRPIVSRGNVVIGRSAWLGDSVCVLPGVTIGESAIIGANSVVVTDIPARTVWAGAPARQIWPECPSNIDPALTS